MRFARQTDTEAARHKSWGSAFCLICRFLSLRTGTSGQRPGGPEEFSPGREALGKGWRLDQPQRGERRQWIPQASTAPAGAAWRSRDCCFPALARWAKFCRPRRGLSRLRRSLPLPGPNFHVELCDTDEKYRIVKMEHLEEKLNSLSGQSPKLTYSRSN